MSKKQKKQKQAATEETEVTMSLSGHLSELRKRITVTFVLIIAVFGVCLYKAKELIELFTDMGEAYGYQYVYISPQELLMEYFSVSLVISLVLCTPVIAWQVWRFVKPGLKDNENIAFALSLIFGMIFFCLGVFFAYKVSLPYILYFLIKVSEGSEIVASVSVQNYISFLLTVFVVFGCVFELPVISVVLTGLGVVKSIWLKKARKIAIVLIFVLSAIITPPDIVSQVMVALPMVALFQIGIMLSVVVEKMRIKRKKKAEATEDADDESEENEE